MHHRAHLERSLLARLRRLVADYFPDPEEADLVLASTLARIEWRKARGFKVRRVCHAGKPVPAFGADTREPDGLGRACRDCRVVENGRRAPPVPGRR